MKVDLQPVEPLSQVVFVHDYLQLVFQDRAFTLYNVVTCSTGSVIFAKASLASVMPLSRLSVRPLGGGACWQAVAVLLKWRCGVSPCFRFGHVRS